MLRLSEAIRLGAMLRPQGRGTMLDERGRTCALGAALDALGQLESRAQAVVLFADQWSWCVAHVRTECPVCGEDNWMPSVHTVMVHLNDDHAWTRERIADWVATIEPSQQVSVSSVLESVASAQ